MNKILIAISTYQRHKTALKETIDFIRKYTKNFYDILICCDSPESFAYCHDLNYLCIGGESKGIARNKNRGISYFLKHPEYEYLFLLDDDCFPIKKGWDNWWINGYKSTGYHHFLFAPLNHYGKITNEKIFENYSVKYHELDGGCFMFCTRKCIETVGGFHPKFKRYGGEHSEFTERIARAKLIPAPKISLVGCEEWMDGWDWQVYSNRKERLLSDITQDDINTGLRIYMEIKKESNNQIFYEPNTK